MATKLTEAQIDAELMQRSGWRRVDADSAHAIFREFKQKNFLDGLAFVVKVAVLAEKANHHPDVLLTYPCVAITLTTHDAGGITDRDFKLAAQIDDLGK